MKIIIIEGTDNVGKDTVIKRLEAEFINCAVVHCEKPPHATSKEQALYQQSSFINLMANTLYQYIAYSKLGIGDEFAMIHNRSWYGEYVYGCMYRDNDPTFVKHMIKTLETALNNSIKPNDLCFITLLSDNMEFLSRNEDGLSLSSGKQDLIKLETERFKEIHNASIIKNKHIVYVNDGNKFRHPDDIYKEVLGYINTTQSFE
jgi:thymidylate kinase